MLARREVLATSAAVLATLGGLGMLTACSKPDLLDGPPPLSHDVKVLLTAITAEEALITTYKRTLSSHSALSGTLGQVLAEHESHLAALRAMIIEPKGGKPVAAPAPGRGPAIPSGRDAAVAMLAGAEQTASTARLGLLTSISPSVAQLLASIAACEASHATVLSGRVPPA